MTNENASFCGVLILAAGQGKRMHSALPKVLHPIAGRPILAHVLNTVREAVPQASIGIVVGHGREQVESTINNDAQFKDAKISWIHQAQQNGTGHAARCAMESEWGRQLLGARSRVIVLPGDSPLITVDLVQQLCQPLARAEALRLLTAVVPNPAGYGRVVRRGKKGPVLRIVEERDATVREKSIHEVAFSMYAFNALFLNAGLARLSSRNAQGEYYLTDLIGQAARARKKIDVLTWHEPDDLRGINDPWELAAAGRVLNERCLRRWARQGVRLVDPFSTWIDAGVELSPDVVIHPGAILRGKTKVGPGATIGPRVVLDDMEIGTGAEVRTGTVGERSIIGPGAKVGPYAHFRPESVVGENAKIGNFVELKKARVGAKTSVAHLSYVGDAEIGDRVNIGCGFITCNFDGRVIDGQRKHKTVIGDDVFMGSDCQTVAPVRIGRGSYVASGSTITEDVQEDSLAIARSRQVTKVGYARKLRGETG